MKKLLVLFVTALAISMAVPSIASAQYNAEAERIKALIYGAGYRTSQPVRRIGGYGYYDPYEMAVLQDFLKIPGILYACRLTMSKVTPGKQVATDCHILTRNSPQGLQLQLAEHPASNALGTQHPGSGIMHFRNYDNTHNPLNENHKTCVNVEVEVQQGSNQVPVQSEVLTQAQQPGQATATTAIRDENRGSAYKPGNRPVVNSTRKFVELYDGDRKPENLVGEMAPGDSWSLDKPKDRYRAFAQVPNRRGGVTLDEIKSDPTDTGWTFIEPEVARGR